MKGQSNDTSLLIKVVELFGLDPNRGIITNECERAFRYNFRMLRFVRLLSLVSDTAVLYRWNNQPRLVEAPPLRSYDSDFSSHNNDPNRKPRTGVLQMVLRLWANRLG